MDNLLKAYKDKNITTLQELSQEMGVSMFYAMKAYDQALEEKLVSQNHLTKKGKRAAKKLK